MRGREMSFLPVQRAADRPQRDVVEHGRPAFAVDEVRVAEVRLLKLGAGKLGALEVSGLQPRILEARASELGAL